MDHVPDEDQPRDEPATPAPRRDEQSLHERIISPLPPATIRMEKSGEWRVVHWGRARSTRIAAPQVARLAAVLLVVVVLSGLLVYGWVALGLPTHLKPTISHARATHATPAPTPMITRILFAELTVALNTAMGCADGAPPPSAQAIYASRNFQTGGPPPNEIALTFDDGPTLPPRLPSSIIWSGRTRPRPSSW